MIKAIIFDCFGVLLGSSYQDRLAELERDEPGKAEDIRAINRAADMGILSNAEATVHMAELLDMEPEELQQEQRETEVPNEALLTFIETLKSDFKIGMLSNISSRERVGIRFEPGRLDALFNTIVASGEEGYMKPDAEIYEITATRLGVRLEECLFIDDIEPFCQAARNIGMQAIRFTSTSQCIADISAMIDRGSERL